MSAHLLMALTSNRHWTVFTASIATVFVFWGITPTQSGIFATNTLNKTVEMASMRIMPPLSLSQQDETFSAKSAQSVVSIMWLNETLPPFMTREYVLAPFGPPEGSNLASQGGNWTSSTLKYFVDVDCETPIAWISDGSPMVNSTWGCSFQLPLPDITTPPDATKIFSTMYAGYFNEDGLADYYLSGACPANESNSFLIQWSKTLSSVPFNGTGTIDVTPIERLQHFNVTNLYCRSTYNVQEVRATIRLPDNKVLGYTPLSEAEPLPSSFFNTTNFEASMSMGHELLRVRKDFPTSNWPSQTAFLTTFPLDMRHLSVMAPFAIGASQLPLENYLDSTNLARSYQSAYRLLFARQMVDALPRAMRTESGSMGQWDYQTQSVILVPAFTYIVEALLLTSVILATIILHSSRTRVSRLHSDPATIACVMSLAADDVSLLEKLRLMDQASEQELEFSLRNRRFRLHPIQGSGSAYRLQLLDMRGDDPLEAFNDELQATKRRQTSLTLRQSDESKAGVIDGLQPTEFKTKLGLVFLATQIALFAVIAGLFVTIQKNSGLPLPSSSRFIRQLLENYLPTAIGTFIEPFWVVLNRHLCFLQPFDEMRQGQKTAKRSLSLEYSSLPPQLTIIKAWSNGNVLLGIVCAMALLANGLAISLSGLFFEDTVNLETAALFIPTYTPQFKPLDGEAAPFTSENKQSLESVYIATSNRTANTPLPPWTDDKLFYFPFGMEIGRTNGTQYHRAHTPAIGTQLACQPLSKDSQFILTGTQKGGAGQYTIPANVKLVVSLMSDEGKEVECVPRGLDVNMNITFGQPIGPSAFEFSYALDGSAKSSLSDASFCREHLAAGWVRAMLADGPRPADETASVFPIQTIITAPAKTIITCRSTLSVETADVLVSADGHVQRTYPPKISTTNVTSFLSTTPSDLLGQFHQIIFENVEGIRWHNDSLPSEFINYLLEQATNSSAHLDPMKAPPSAESMIPPFTALYSQLFATLVGRNMNQLLIPIGGKNVITIEGFTVESTTRVFMSKPMFILAETILALYIIVTVALYLRRPWKILCRMPTSLASVIAFIAASHVLKDFRGTAGMTKGKLSEHLEKLDDRYGFGTFIGTDEKTHIGIEKYPFLAPLAKKYDMARQGTNDSTGSMRDQWRSVFTQWRSGKVREGGWM